MCELWKCNKMFLYGNGKETTASRCEYCYRHRSTRECGPRTELYHYYGTDDALRATMQNTWNGMRFDRNQEVRCTQ